MLGWIADPLGENAMPVEAPASGVIIGEASLPLVNEGEALYHIARFDETGTAAEVVEQFQAAHDPETDTRNIAEPPISE
jgi:hypothetical protein